MAVVEATAPMTMEQLLALPDDGVERWLIRGQLREKPATLGQLRGKKWTVRNRWHSRVMACVVYQLEGWRRHQPEPRGSVLCGEAGVRLRREPDSMVGIDVVYISAEVAAGNLNDTRLIDGVPVLAVEILSPNDTQEEIDDKIDEYLVVGVPLVWIIDVRHRTVRIYRPDQEPELVNVHQELSGEPHLPGFRVPVADLFA